MTSRIEKSSEICGGDARIRDTRITIWGLVEWRRLGLSNEDILSRVQGLTQADLEAAWDYAGANSLEIDEAIHLNAEYRTGVPCSAWSTQSEMREDHMGKLLCYCGRSIDLSPHPNKCEFRVFSEPLLETILQELVAEFPKCCSSKDFEKRLFEIVIRGTKEPFVVHECPSCGRLYLYRSSDRAPSSVYVPEKISDSFALLQDS